MAKNLATEREMILANEWIRMALDETSIVAITDANGDIVYVNKMFCKISKYSEAELLGKNHRILKSGLHTPAFYHGLWSTITSGKIWRADIKNKAKDGSHYWVRTTIVPILDENNNPKRYVSIRTDITEIKELRDKIQQLELQKEADTLKEEFTSMITHEFKTPLIPIQGYSELLLDDTLGQLNIEQKRVLQLIYDNSVLLSKMMQDVLDVHKLEMGKLKLDLSDSTIHEIIEKCISTFRIHAQARNVALENIARIDMKMVCDVGRTVQILNNLVSNSLKFVGEKSGAIQVGGNFINNSIVFSVKDNGIGIPDDKIRNLFKKFYQVDTSLSRKSGGTGLGLAISKGLVDAHGGNIWVESQEGKGTTVFFSIPQSGAYQ